jgi:hypothetical protein
MRPLKAECATPLAQNNQFGACCCSQPRPTDNNNSDSDTTRQRQRQQVISSQRPVLFYATGFVCAAGRVLWAALCLPDSIRAQRNSRGSSGGGGRAARRRVSARLAGAADDDNIVRLLIVLVVVVGSTSCCRCCCWHHKTWPWCARRAVKEFGRPTGGGGPVRHNEEATRLATRHKLGAHLLRPFSSFVVCAAKSAPGRRPTSAILLSSI